MIILSQNGIVFINSSNIKSFYVCGGKVFATYGSERAYIGEYRDEDRAIEILAQITTAIQRGQRVFYMPEE